MTCKKCGQRLQVTRTLPDESNCTVTRERICVACGSRFVTEEKVTQRIKKIKKC